MPPRVIFIPVKDEVGPVCIKLSLLKMGYPQSKFISGSILNDGLLCS